MQCNALKLSNMNLHTAAIGTAFNIYHVMFDLLQPLYEWQTSHTEVKAEVGVLQDTLTTLEQRNEQLRRQVAQAQAQRQMVNVQNIEEFNKRMVMDGRKTIFSWIYPHDV